MPLGRGAATSLDLGHEGSPGAVNTLHSLLDPVGITSVDQDSGIVAVSSNNTIRADVSGEAGVSSVTLHYRAVTSNDYQYTDVDYQSMPMSDNGVAPDLLAGDGEYTLSMAFATNRSIIRYHVTAVSSNGLVARSPQVDDQSDDYGYWVETSSIQSNIPNWHILTDDAEAIRYPNTLRACVVSPGGQVFTDIQVRHRGSPFTTSFHRTGLAVRMHRDRRYDAWFGNNQDGINFRHRLNDSSFRYRRVVNEYLAYFLQERIGLVTPNFRHACVWVNGWPTITGELESPNEGFLSLHDQDSLDYLSRAGYSGRRIVDGDPALDNYESIYTGMESLGTGVRETYIRTNLWYESVRYSVAFQNMVGNGDQFFRWNMFQHRLATNGLWAQHPWDIDQAFNVETNGIPGTYMPELHPYYQTPDHPSIWDGVTVQPLGQGLFYPESGSGSANTEPYRYRQQMTHWRYYHTLFTTNYLFPILDALATNLVPAYQQIESITSVDETRLSNKVAEVKNFINLRRDFLHDGAWSDRDTAIWNSGNVYDPSQVVINEIMYNPILGGEYIELVNTSTQTIDLSWWTLTAGNEQYNLPLGTMLGPTSFVVVADNQFSLTNAFSALSDSASMIHRYEGIPIWDHPITFLSKTEYASRIVEVPEITLPGAGALVRLSDLTGATIDEVSYGVVSPWPAQNGYSLELLSPTLENSTAGVWRTSFSLGTPGFANSATNDQDGDQLLDAFEELVIAAYGGVNDLDDVDPEDDQDGDGFRVDEEFLLGLDPTLADGANLEIDIQDAGLPSMTIDFPTIALSGAVYNLFSDRLYSLQTSSNLTDGSSWAGVTNYIDLIGSGQLIVHTNTVLDVHRAYRYEVGLGPAH